MLGITPYRLRLGKPGSRFCGRSGGEVLGPKCTLVLLGESWVETFDGARRLPGSWAD